MTNLAIRGQRHRTAATTLARPGKRPFHTGDYAAAIRANRSSKPPGGIVVLGSAGAPTMANADHLKRLRQGVDAWNAWREKKPSIRPDLSGSGTNLSKANLFGAKLRGADLQE